MAEFLFGIDFGSASVQALKNYLKANNVSWQDDSREKIWD